MVDYERCPGEWTVRFAFSDERSSRDVLALRDGTAAAWVRGRFRDRGRQDVAPGAPMDGFMAFPKPPPHPRRRCAPKYYRQRIALQALTPGHS